MGYQEEVVALLKEIVANQQLAQENQRRAIAAQQVAIRRSHAIAIILVAMIALYMIWSVVVANAPSK